MKFQLLTISILFSGVLFANRPKLPDPSNLDQDFKAQFGKPIETYFEERNQNKACREALENSKRRFQAYKKAGKFRLMETERQNHLVPLSQTCGDCVVHIEPPQLLTLSMWAKSDGICYHPTGALERKSLMERGINFLTNAQSYAQRRPNGFNYVLEFLGITRNGIPLPNLAKVEEPPFWAFVAVKAISRFALYHLIENRFYALSQGREFVLEFKNIQEPSGFRPPNVLDEKSVKQVLLPLSGSQGFWYLNDSGIVRYRNEADLSALGIKFDSQYALLVHTDTMLHFDDLIRGPSEVPS